MPLFIFVSDFVLALKYGANLSKKTFFVNRTKVVIPPYVIFSAIYLIVPRYLFNGQLKFPSGGEFYINLFQETVTGTFGIFP